MKTTPNVLAQANPEFDEKYQEFREVVSIRLSALLQIREVFTTDITGLYDRYLAMIPEDIRQTYTCSACRHFIEHFGGLLIVEDGMVHSAVWPANVENIGPWRQVSDALATLACKANVTGVFKTNSSVLGTPITGDWQHFGAPLMKGSLCQKFPKTLG